MSQESGGKCYHLLWRLGKTFTERMPVRWGFDVLIGVGQGERKSKGHIQKPSLKGHGVGGRQGEL
jgi:hypothetical protein